MVSSTRRRSSRATPPMSSRALNTRYSGSGGKVLVLRIGGRITGDGQMELSRILATGDNLARVVGETKQWFDPKGRRTITS